MSNEIIVVKQLPVIVEQLAQVKETVIERVQTATSLVCTDETVKEVKKARAELNSELKAWEEKRKEVKTAVMTPYEKFEAVYKDCVSDTYRKADADLKAKIDGVEKELKDKKAAEVRDYFDEYKARWYNPGGEEKYTTIDSMDLELPANSKLRSLYVQANANAKVSFTINQMVCTKAAWNISQTYQPHRPTYQELYEMVLALQSGSARSLSAELSEEDMR